LGKWLTTSNHTKPAGYKTEWLHIFTCTVINHKVTTVIKKISLYMQINELWYFPQAQAKLKEVNDILFFLIVK